MNNKNLIFYSLINFYPRKDIIKQEFMKLRLEEKRIYKMYVYSLCFENEHTKDLIWEYLNGWEESQFELAKEYRNRTEPKKRRRKNAKNRIRRHRHN